MIIPDAANGENNNNNNNNNNGDGDGVDDIIIVEDDGFVEAMSTGLAMLRMVVLLLNPVLGFVVVFSVILMLAAGVDNMYLQPNMPTTVLYSELNYTVNTYYAPAGSYIMNVSTMRNGTVYTSYTSFADAQPGTYMLSNSNGSIIYLQSCEGYFQEYHSYPKSVVETVQTWIGQFHTPTASVSVTPPWMGNLSDVQFFPGVTVGEMRKPANNTNRGVIVNGG